MRRQVNLIQLTCAAVLLFADQHGQRFARRIISDALVFFHFSPNQAEHFGRPPLKPLLSLPDATKSKRCRVICRLSRSLCLKYVQLHASQYWRRPANAVTYEGVVLHLREQQMRRQSKGRKWVAKVKTDSTHPPPGLFKKSAPTIARTLASKKVSPKGPQSGMRMLTYFINRAGRGLSRSRRAELERAKSLLSKRLQSRAKGSVPRRKAFK